jgi:hypothetical protein
MPFDVLTLRWERRDELEAWTFQGMGYRLGWLDRVRQLAGVFHEVRCIDQRACLEAHHASSTNPVSPETCGELLFDDFIHAFVMAVGPVLIALALGIIIAWVLAGFKRDATSSQTGQINT